MGATKRDAEEIFEEAPQETGLTFRLNNLFEANKKGISDIAAQIIQKVEDGHLDSVQAFGNARKGTELFKLLEEGLRPHMEKHIQAPSGVEGITYNGVNYVRADIGTKYDYKQCKDAIWNDLNGKIEALVEARKCREFFLKGLKKEQEETDEDTGETWTVKPPKKTGRSGIKAELK